MANRRFRIEFTVDVHNEGVTKDWNWSDDDIKDFALQELECMSPYPFDITFSKVDNPWQTGTPPIEGIDKDNQYCYALCFYYDGWWLSDYLFKANHEEGCFENSPNNGQQVCKFKFGDDIAWQKIEPFEEASNVF